MSHMKEGMQLQMRQKQNEEVIPVIITDVADDKVTIDANHPLAGKDLTFDIEIIDVDK